MRAHVQRHQGSFFGATPLLSAVSRPGRFFAIHNGFSAFARFRVYDFWHASLRLVEPPGIFSVSLSCLFLVIFCRLAALPPHVEGICRFRYRRAPLGSPPSSPTRLEQTTVTASATRGLMWLGGELHDLAVREEGKER
eukprot:GEMP01126164.1.p1 GENE.GEMP01126164.1~~GEMP01126164.1.p1  ORF type:complete len:138 (-),score=6.52 GEMP01126164.1:7-420(-)